MRSLRILPALLLLLLLGGCVFPSGDELLAAPKPSSNYQSLQTELEKQLAQGVSYASPSEGENRSSIQLADLDNDGVEEAITFFRGATSATSNKFTVAVYRSRMTATSAPARSTAAERHCVRSNFRCLSRAASAAWSSPGACRATEQVRLPCAILTKTARRVSFLKPNIPLWS